MTRSATGAAIMRALVVAASIAGSVRVHGGAFQDDDPGRITHRYDLRSILATGVAVMHDVDTRTHQSSAWLVNLEPATYDPGRGVHAAVNGDEIIELLELAVSRVGDDASFDLRSGWLQVRASRAAHETVASALDLLQSAAQDSVEVEVYRVDDHLIPAGTSAVLDPLSASALLKGVEESLVCRQAMMIGRNVRLGDDAVISYLSDEDVEGGGFHACDPTVSVIRAGLELGVRIDRAVEGGSFVVRIWGRDGGPSSGIGTSRTEDRVPRAIETLSVPTSRFVGSAILRLGGALVLDHDGGKQGAVIVHLRSARTKRSPVGLTPLGALALPPLRQGPPWVPEPEPSAGWWHGAYDEVLEEWIDESGTMADGYMGRLGDSTHDYLPPLFGSSALSGLPGDGDAALRGPLGELRSSLKVGTVALEVAYELVDPDEVESVLNGETLAPFAERASGRLLGAAIEGDSLVLVGGIERAYVRDHDVQISAGGASPPDPIPSSIFEGVTLWFAPVRRPNGYVAAGLHFSMRRSPGEFRSLETRTHLDARSKSGMPRDRWVRSHDLRLPRVQRADARTMIDAPPRQWTLVTARPLAGSGQILVVVARTDVR